MEKEEKPEGGKVIPFPAVPTLPSGVYDTGRIAEIAAETDLAENPPDDKEKSGGEDEPPRAS